MNRHLKASELYHHPELKFNCAQAIAYKWATSTEEAQIRAIEFQKYGGGKAPEGACGALYAGLERLANNSETQELLKKRFLSSAASLACRDIRKTNQLACKGCVELVDEFLEVELKK